MSDKPPETELEYLRQIRNHTKNISTAITILLLLVLIAVAFSSCSVLF
jgi:hypothetical protein